MKHIFRPAGLFTIAALLVLVGAACSPAYRISKTEPITNEPATGALPTNEPPAEPSGKQTSGPKLDLSNQGLTKLPDYVLSRTDLTKLDVSHNQLTGALPAEIRHLSQLTVLDMSDNKMTGIPAEVGQFSQLEVLDLSYNQFTGLPYEIGNLKNLQRLILTGNDYAAADLAVILRSIPKVEVIGLKQ